MKNTEFDNTLIEYKEAMIQVNSALLDIDVMRRVNIIEFLINHISDESIIKETLADFNMLYDKITTSLFDLPFSIEKMNKMKEKYNL